LTAWRTAQGVPRRVTAQLLSAEPAGNHWLTTPLYMDFMSPVTINDWGHVLSRKSGHEAWLILRELLPALVGPSAAGDGAAHASEWVFQLSW
jgi:hypothetical protein